MIIDQPLAVVVVVVVVSPTFKQSSNTPLLTLLLFRNATGSQTLSFPHLSPHQPQGPA